MLPKTQSDTNDLHKHVKEIGQKKKELYNSICLNFNMQNYGGRIQDSDYFQGEGRDCFLGLKG